MPKKCTLLLNRCMVFFIMIKKKIGILERISAKMPIDPNSNILFFSKLDEPIRWISKNFKIHFVFSIDAHDIFLGNLRPKVFQNVLFRCYMLMVHFQPFFGFLIITQQFDQDLKKKLDIAMSSLLYYTMAEKPH